MFYTFWLKLSLNKPSFSLVAKLKIKCKLLFHFVLEFRNLVLTFLESPIFN